MGFGWVKEDCCFNIIRSSDGGQCVLSNRKAWRELGGLVMSNGGGKTVITESEDETTLRAASWLFLNGRCKMLDALPTLLLRRCLKPAPVTVLRSHRPKIPECFVVGGLGTKGNAFQNNLGFALPCWTAVRN